MEQLQTARQPDVVLVVEDDPGTAVLQQRELQRSGYHVECLSSAEAALERVRGGHISAIVLDQQLSGRLSGLEVCGRLKQEGSTIPIIMVTGSSDESTVIEALRLGVRDFVPKRPEYLTYLPQAVARVLDRIRLESQLSRSMSARRRRGSVLLVGADNRTAQLEQRQIERAGHAALIASSTEEALELVKQGGIALLLLDQSLDGSITGLQLYQQLRASGYELPAIIVATRSDETIAIEALRAGIRDYIPRTPEYLTYLPSAVERVFDRIELEAELLDSRARLAGMIGSAMDAIVSVDSGLNVTLFNAAAERIFGCLGGEALGQPISKFIPGAFSRGPSGELCLFEQPLRQAADFGVPAGERITGMRADGTAFPLELSVSQAEVLGEPFITVIARDISERVTMEEQLRERADQLLEASRRKDEFVAMLAHELRNPLAPLRYALQILSHRSDSQLVDEMRGMMERQVKHMARLIDDLLDVSRIARGKVLLKLERLDIARLVKVTLQDSLAQVGAHGLSMKLNVPDKPVWTVGDPTRLAQVLDNLLSNAIKFNDSSGEIAVTLTVDNDSHEAHLSVSDTGVGIEPGMLPRLFEVFTQADKSLDRSRGGLGLGLALVRGLVELHGGRVAADSEGLGRGATFHVYLPIEEELPALTEHRPPVVRPQQQLSILVIEDNRDSAQSLKLLLEVYGHTVYLAHNGNDGVSAAKEHLPDVVICDIGLPGFDGFSVASALREDEATAGICLIALTGYGQEEDKRRSQLAGFDEHVVKPADPEVLLELLARCSIEERSAEPT